MSQYDVNLFVNQYSMNVNLLMQQKVSRLEKAVTIGNHFGEKAEVINQFGTGKAVKITGRYKDIIPANTKNDQRWVYPTDYYYADWTSKLDQLRMVIDPKSGYVRVAVAALMREMDYVLINEGLNGTNRTGKDGLTTVTLPNSQVVPVTVGGGGQPTRFNVQKLLAAREILKSNEIEDDEELWVALSAKQETDLMNDPLYVSREYSSSLVLDNGRIKSYMGFNFLHSEQLPKDSNGYRINFVWAKTGLYLGKWEGLKVKIDQLLGKEDDPWQIKASMTIGATRTEEKKVVAILSSEA